MRLVLASASPRRSEILKRAGYSFAVCPADVDESQITETAPSKLVKELAALKAQAVYDKSPGKQYVAVIGADTVVVLGNKILGKPKDEKDAYEMLCALSDKKHYVFTGVCVKTQDFCKTFFNKTEVEFTKLSKEEIRSYIKSGEPMDKAGAYGIQGRGSVIVKRIDGDFYSVMGLPVAQTAEVLSQIGIKRNL